MVITINGASPQSLRRAANKVRQYKNSVISNNKELLKDLVYAGMEEAIPHIFNVASDYERPNFATFDPHVYGDGKNGPMSANIRLQGEQVAFVEFGAGVHYNPTPHGSLHPLGVKLGYTIGDYGQHGGLNDGWWYDGHYYHGTPTAMPLYHASVAIKLNARDLAKTRFGS